MRFLPFEYAVRNLGRSPQRLAANVAGSCLVVLLALTAAAFVRGMRSTLSAPHEQRNVLLVSAGSEDSLERSQVAAGVASIVEAAIPGLRRRLDVAYVSPEVYMMSLVRLRHEEGEELQAMVRGFTQAAFLVHPEVQIVEGRAPQPGREEIMVGELAAAQLGVQPAALELGQALWFDGRAWTIVGRFSAPRTVMNAEVWCPLTDLQIAAKRDSPSYVVVTLEEAEFGDVDAFCKQRLDLELVALREADYYARLLDFYAPIRRIVWATALLVALGGLLGGLNTTYAAFAARVRELGTLQVLGFGRPAIVLSLVQESTLAGSAGALLAVGLGLLLLDGVGVSFSMWAFELVVDSAVTATSLAAGVGLGVVGALPPAWRCLRLPIAAALRSA